MCLDKTYFPPDAIRDPIRSIVSAKHVLLLIPPSFPLPFKKPTRESTTPAPTGTRDLPPKKPTREKGNPSGCKRTVSGASLARRLKTSIDDASMSVSWFARKRLRSLEDCHQYNIYDSEFSRELKCRKITIKIY